MKKNKNLLGSVIKKLGTPNGIDGRVRLFRATPCVCVAMHATHLLLNKIVSLPLQSSFVSLSSIITFPHLSRPFQRLPSSPSFSFFLFFYSLSSTLLPSTFYPFLCSPRLFDIFYLSRSLLSSERYLVGKIFIPRSDCIYSDSLFLSRHGNPLLSPSSRTRTCTDVRREPRVASTRRTPISHWLAAVNIQPFVSSP